MSRAIRWAYAGRPPVLLPRRHPEPRLARACRSSSMKVARWATSTLSHAFGAVFDNPDLVAALRGGRRGGGLNRATRHVVAFQQIPQPGARWRGDAADICI